jgi:hypothetical protein
MDASDPDFRVTRFAGFTGQASSATARAGRHGQNCDDGMDQGDGTFRGAAPMTGPDSADSTQGHCADPRRWASTGTPIL